MVDCPFKTNHLQGTYIITQQRRCNDEGPNSLKKKASLLFSLCPIIRCCLLEKLIGAIGHIKQPAATNLREDTSKK